MMEVAVQHLRSTQAVSRSCRRWLDNLARRTLDVCASLAGLILLAPVFSYVALLIKRDSPGPVFYKGSRVGKDGREFGIWKFRTMYETAESYEGPKITPHADRRITPVGKWLRDTKLNELPQLWNVLVGDMSLVGPRPEDPAFVEEWPEEVRRELLSVRPGITSPASVLYRDEEALLRASDVIDDYLITVLPSKLRLDLLHVRNRTILSDLDVIFLTLVALIPQFKRKPVPEHLLYWGPLSIFVNRHCSWFLVDAIVAAMAVAATGMLWRSSGPLDLGWQLASLTALVMALLFALINSLLGLKHVYWSKASPAEALDLAASSGLVTAGLIGVNQLALPAPLLPWGMLAVSGLLAFLGFVTVRYRARIITGMASRWLQMRGGGAMGERVLIVGAGDVGQFAVWLLRKAIVTGAFTIVGMVDDDPRKQGMRIEGCKVLGTTKDIPDLIRSHDIRLAFLAISRLPADQRDKILSGLDERCVSVVSIPNILLAMRHQFSTDQRRREAEAPMLDPRFLNVWLDQLEEALGSGDCSACRSCLHELRSAISCRGEAESAQQG